ncbi:Tubulin-tyrosine ligase family protein [Tritrichomonas foetus]|uniref:Tubulin--tyrosine ligase-like protein 5 n=1 Tax=Tritrichomonas foetus TaxID=1144522 RepID=A0A1J4K487_9EUKA|nr:Tubulin-tyrosine ligase family protein [Tritrichomonas foetus]|eukprot:OHT04502.1 Tubulin-tyrosine ligase family protein [Tritrichomonas foetus]
MNNLVTLFNTIPLPYKYVRVPKPEERPNTPKAPIRYYINRVITNLTRATFKHSGFRVTQDEREWNASWGRQYTMEEYQKCEAWQKINHYAGAFLMGRKDHLNCRMNELKSRVGEFASFYPTSYLLPGDQAKLNRDWKEKPVWIVKPSASSRGRGIHLLASAANDPPTEPGVVQEYITNPLLITKRKFDIRLYVLIPNIEPLRIYIHSAGLARFCTHEYDPNGSPDDLNMHLTNFSVNKEDDRFIRCDTKESVSDSKWSLDFFLDYMKKQGHDPSAIMKEFERVSIATIIAGMCEIKKTHLKNIRHRHTSYEMYGIDIMLDEDMKCHLIEVNISPSLSGLDSKLDERLKYPLNLDLLRMARIIECNPSIPDPCPGVEIIDKLFFESMSKERIAAVVDKGEDPWQNPVFADFVIIRDFIEETQISSNFRLIFPLPQTMEKFFPCFNKLSYRDIVFTKWMAMSVAKRYSVVKEHWSVYKNGMESVTKALQPNLNAL